MQELNECLYLNSKVEYETIKAFQDYMNTLEEMRIKTLLIYTVKKIQIVLSDFKFFTIKFG